MRIVLNRKDEIPREPDSEQAIHVSFGRPGRWRRKIAN
jgi:hypothetical protein